MIFSIYAIVTTGIVEHIEFMSWGTNLVYGKFFPIFYYYAMTAITFSLGMFIYHYIKLDKKERLKIIYFLEGLFIFMIITVLIHTVIRSLAGSDEYYRFGNYSAIVFVYFTAYAIAKHHLFNIRIFLTEIAFSLIMSAIVVQAGLSRGIFDLSVNIVILFITSYGGYLLLKSIRTEIKQKEDLAILAQELKEANEHLKEVDKLKDDFLSMASHELNTPIAAIEGYLSMILEEGMGGKIPEKARGYLDSVFVSSKRLASMVKDLLNVSRIESGRIHIIWEQKPVEDIVNQAITEVMSKAREAKHSLTFEEPKHKMPATWFDITRITEVVINILGNAIKYTDPGGKIVARVTNDEHKIVVSVEDNGKGIPKERQQAVFEKFTQVDVMKDEVKGTGLGMYISKRFIELMGGKIWFTSEGAGKGTTFYFSLPIIKEKPSDPHEGEGLVLK